MNTITNSWIVVADETRGRIFNARDRTGGIAEIKTLIHPESRVPEKSLATHTTGTDQTQNGREHHGLNEQGKLKDYQALLFAKEIAGVLEAARHKNRFARLIIVAAPRFLGALRKELSVSLSRLVAFELDQDLTKHSTEDVRSHLPEHLPLID